MTKYQSIQNQIDDLNESRTLVYNHLDSIRLKTNSKLRQLLVDLTGIEHITTNITDESTTIYLEYGSVTEGVDHWRNHDITIYHRLEYNFHTHKYNDSRTYELSWFSSRAKIGPDNNDRHYFEYLQLLGLIANKLNNDTQIQQMIQRAASQKRATQDHLSELDQAIRKLEQERRDLANNLKLADIDRTIYDMERLGTLMVLTPTEPKSGEVYTQQETNDLYRRYYYGRRDQHSTNYYGVSISKTSKKTKMIKLHTVWFNHATDETGNYLKNDDGNHLLKAQLDTSWKEHRYTHEEFKSFLYRNWPLTDEYYQEQAQLVPAN